MNGYLGQINHLLLKKNHPPLTLIILFNNFNLIMHELYTYCSLITDLLDLHE